MVTIHILKIIQKKKKTPIGKKRTIRMEPARKIPDEARGAFMRFE